MDTDFRGLRLIWTVVEERSADISLRGDKVLFRLVEPVRDVVLFVIAAHRSWQNYISL
jgi:hypothetical protein